MSYVDSFLAQNPGPTWTCCFCEKDIYERGLTAGGLVVHHVDENSMNDALDNLAPAHRRCHSEYHMSGRTVSDETRARLRGPKSAETRARMSAAQKGRPGRKLSAETKAKLSAIVSGRRYDEETRAKMRIARAVAAERRRNEL